MIFPNLKFRGVEDNGITVPILISVLIMILIFIERKKLRIKTIETIHPSSFIIHNSLHPLPGASLLFPDQSAYGQHKSLPYMPVGNRTGVRIGKTGLARALTTRSSVPRGTAAVLGHQLPARVIHPPP